MEKKVLVSVPLNWQRIIFNIIPPKAEETSTWVKHERNLMFGFAQSIPAKKFAITGFAIFFSNERFEENFAEMSRTSIISPKCDVFAGV